MKRKGRFPLTLIEIMIVMVIIGLVSAIFAINARGSLDEGRSFKTEQGSRQIVDVLTLEWMKGASLEDISKRPLEIVKRSNLIADPAKAMQDGWGNPYHIVIIDQKIYVISPAFLNHLQSKGVSEKEQKQRYPWMFPPGG